MTDRPPVKIDAFDTLLTPGPKATRIPRASAGVAVAKPTPDDSTEELFRQSFSIYQHQLTFLRETATRIKSIYPRADVDQGTIVRALLDDLSGVRSERTLREALFRTVADRDAAERV